MRSLPLLASLFLSACGGSSASSGSETAQPPAPVSAPAASSAAAATPASTTPAAPTAIRSGIYHLVGPVDAVNLELDVEHGTFHWAVDGCDYGHSAAGTATAEGEGFVLTAPDLTWFHSPGFRNEVDRVTVRLGDAGALIATGVAHGDPFEQRWEQGGICPNCGGLGPTGLAPCASPFPD